MLPLASRKLQYVVREPYVGAGVHPMRLTVGLMHDVDLTGFGQRLEMPVDGGQADGLAAPAELGEQVVRRTEAVRVAKGGVHRLALPGDAPAPATERAAVIPLILLRRRHRTILPPEPAGRANRCCL